MRLLASSTQPQLTQQTSSHIGLTETAGLPPGVNSPQPNILTRAKAGPMGFMSYTSRHPNATLSHVKQNEMSLNISNIYIDISFTNDVARYKMQYINITITSQTWTVSIIVANKTH